MKVSDKQMTAVLELPPQQQFEHFVKVVVDWEEAWGLYDGGWAMCAKSDGTEVFPLWPAKEYAAACADGDWRSYVPRAIPLDELKETVLPELKEEGVLPGVFFSPSGRGVTPSVDQLLAALASEELQYEDPDQQ